MENTGRDIFSYEQLTERNSTLLKEKISKAVIGIAGCGGIGSNAAIAFARTGVKKLIIADFDTIEPSNLNRQQFAIKDLGRFKTDALEEVIRSFNPFIEIEKHTTKLNLKNIFTVFRECPILIEAFDKVSEKSMIMKSFADVRFADKYLIIASGIAGFTSSNNIKTKKISKNIFICGDNSTDNIEENGLMLPRVMIAAGHQANLALKFIQKVY